MRSYPTGPQRAAERAMLEQAQAGYRRLVADWRVQPTENLTFIRTSRPAAWG